MITRDNDFPSCPRFSRRRVNTHVSSFYCKLLRAPPCRVWGQQPVRSGGQRGRRGDRGPQGIRGSVRKGRIDPIRRCHSLLPQLILFLFPFFSALLASHERGARRGSREKEKGKRLLVVRFPLCCCQDLCFSSLSDVCGNTTTAATGHKTR